MTASTGRVGLRATLATLAALALLSTLLGVATPATAQSASGGEAAGTGTETINYTGDDYGTFPQPSENPFCLGVDDSTYTVDVTGVFTADNPSDIYVGDAQIQFHMGTQDGNNEYFIAPQGTYTAVSATGLTTNNICDPRSFGPQDPIQTDVTVTTPNSTGPGIWCDNQSGGTGEGYFRAGNNFSVTWTGQCEVQGNVNPDGTSSTTSSGTVHAFEGNLNPCAPVPATSTNTCDNATYSNNQLQGTWTYGDS